MRKMLAAALAAVTMLAAGAVPAAADDAALKRAMDGPACDIERSMERFARASDRMGRLGRADGTSLPEMRRALGPADRAARAVEARMARCAGVLERQETSSADGERAQQLLVDGLLAFGDGAGVYRRVIGTLRAITNARSRAEVQRKLQALRTDLREFQRLWFGGARDLRAADRILRRL